MTLSWPKFVIAWVLVAAGALLVRTAGLLVAGQPPTLAHATTDVTLLALWAAASPFVFRSARRLPVHVRSPMPNAAIHLVLGSSFIVASNVAIRLPILWSGGVRALVADTAMGIATFYPAALVCYLALVAIGQRLGANADASVAASTDRTESTAIELSAAYASDESLDHSRLVIREWNRVHFIALDDIDWIEAANNHVVVHANARQYKGRERMSDVEARLTDRRFVRVHRSAIVHVAKIREVQPLARGDHAVILTSGKVVRVSRSRRSLLESALGTPL